MIVREVKDSEKDLYNQVVTHVIQSWQWGDFRKKMGLDLVRLGHFEGNKLISAYQLTFHPVPFFKYTVGYLPKGPMPDEKMVEALKTLGERKNAAFIKIEPNVLKIENGKLKMENLGLVPSKKSLFTKYNFLIDLTKTEDQLLAAMHPKTRYNINIAQKKGVTVYDSTSDEDFEIYLKLYFETTKRQKYFGHTSTYHKLVWQTLMQAKMARLLIAKYQGKPLVAWMLLNFGQTIYYPYGGSSKEHKEVMASNLIAWEAIRLGKKNGFKIFDMWGALAPDARESDPWYGFHRFKAGYGPIHVEYVGTYDLILKPSLYNTLNIADKMRWMFLRMRG
ncbi:hypothetical protein A2W45_02435 [Candidatus Curtissbacteria bacterium RIFCSPHIGHO2_12_41_11]|uniref:BioF2-like acetyltransferase domain-containing protein n=3 Tax=Candidatus Curtissiibacteriota TaxID=1752717 RepID=A0A1F5HR91_9BACT|nr:MAG: hypothetical protein A2Z54_01905 [Candidatus Curtissbacteria bacterium RIFCSPHIGHO2_02_39_8]OGD99945.1 MAG: hypothetical protein A2W45_02435 [Candidatus Curtissbacteria bacterium RIFCSPHIGHO2_12_41_11]OGE06583.1 MAG: hypothetical protein A2W70_03925 [Candidatus Curtissbacteria bacterium RIFCSPLOWO2_02_41_11]